MMESVPLPPQYCPHLTVIEVWVGFSVFPAKFAGFLGRMDYCLTQLVLGFKEGREGNPREKSTRNGENFC